MFGPTGTASFYVRATRATRKMRPTLLLLSLVAIALMSGTEAQPIWNGEQAFDEMDDDGCSTRNFDRVLVATVEITGRAPNPACAQAVFDKICDQCEDNIQCYLKLGRQVGPETRECQPRRLRRSTYDCPTCLVIVGEWWKDGQCRRECENEPRQWASTKDLRRAAL